jgi:hypothetical protein
MRGLAGAAGDFRRPRAGYLRDVGVAHTDNVFPPGVCRTIGHHTGRYAGRPLNSAYTRGLRGNMSSTYGETVLELTRGQLLDLILAIEERLRRLVRSTFRSRREDRDRLMTRGVQYCTGIGQRRVHDSPPLLF